MKPCWASQVGKDPERILGTVQSSRIAGVKRNVLLYKGKNAKALQMESMLLYAIFFALYEKAMCNIPPCAPKEHTDLAI